MTNVNDTRRLHEATEHTAQRLRRLVEENMTDGERRLREFLDSREFYDLMQAYRHAPQLPPAAVVEAYEAVKTAVLRSTLTQLQEQTPAKPSQVIEALIQSRDKEAQFLLVAAAADLYAALRDCCAALGGLKANPNAIPESARLALAKAEGAQLVHRDTQKGPREIPSSPDGAARALAGNE
jgi:hypothetical protein